MSVVSGSGACRITLGGLVERYGYELVPPAAEGVTVTALADDIDSVIPGCLYVPSGSASMDRLEHAAMRGAYAALVPRSLRGAFDRLTIPLLLGDYDEARIAALAGEMAGSPAKSLAMFACYGSDAETVERDVRRLSDFLHMLGNPVGVICASDTQSLNRYLDLQYPLNALDMQRTLSVCVEDGASAVVIALDERTVRHGALNAVELDVFGIEGASEAQLRDTSDAVCSRYGCTMNERGRVVGRTAESDALARQVSDAEFEEPWKSLSLAISMAMAAGVRRSNIKSALRVSRELS